MAKSFSYNTTEAGLAVRVTIREIDKHLSAGVRHLLGKKELTHFLTRVRTTIATYEQERTVDKDNLRRLENRANQQGRPATAHPKDILKFLDPEEVAASVDEFIKAKVNQVLRAVEEVKKARIKVAAQLSSVHFAGAALLENPDIPADVKAQVKRTLDSLPTEADLNTPRLPGDKQKVTVVAPQNYGTPSTFVPPTPPMAKPSPQTPESSFDALFDEEAEPEATFDLSSLMDED